MTWLAICLAVVALLIQEHRLYKTRKHLNKIDLAVKALLLLSSTKRQLEQEVVRQKTKELKDLGTLLKASDLRLH